MTYDDDDDFQLSTWRCPGCGRQYPRSSKCPGCGKCNDCCKDKLSFAAMGEVEKRMLAELRRPYDPEKERANNRLMADPLRKRYEDI